MINPLDLNADEKIICQTLERIRKKEFPQIEDLFISGGWVRDKILGVESKDLDMVVPEQAVLSLVVRIPEYFKYGLLKEEGYNVYFSADRGSFEIDQAPIEGYKVHMIDLIDTVNEHIKIDIRKLKGDSVEADLYTRDFTINSLYYSTKTNEVIDNCNVG